MAGGFVSAVTNFLSAATNGKTVPVSPTNPLPVAVISGGGGGGGGGGAVTVADGADVTQGTTTNAAYADTTGAAATTVIGGLKGLFVALAAMSAKLPASLGIKASAASLSVAPASDALFQAALTSGTAAALTAGQFTGTTIAMPTANGCQLQLNGLSADSLLIQHSMDNVNFVTATLLKQDLSQVAATALTGAAANGIYSVMVFGGYLKMTRTGTADTLSGSVRSTS